VFERLHHQRIARVLEALDANLLAAQGCLFGGGTAIALRHGEYRESVDIDFLVSDATAYRTLRQRLTGPDGLASITRRPLAFTQARELRADAYGLRTLLNVDGTDIKFEIVREARIELESPGPDDLVCGIATLTPLDLATSKLLANADRWADDGVFSRDLIDLAMMAPSLALFRQAVAKAEQAYGDSVRASLAKAIAQLQSREGRLERCMAIMAIAVPRAVLWQRIRVLARGLTRMAPPVSH
jgi:hypothetical protein